jgi:hypothetical protein
MRVARFAAAAAAAAWVLCSTIHADGARYSPIDCHRAAHATPDELEAANLHVRGEREAEE